MDEVARGLRRADGALPGGRGDLPRGDRRPRSRRAPTTAPSSRSRAGSRPRNLGTNRLLDAIVEDLPSPVKHGGLEIGEVTLEPVEDKELFAYVFKTRADPFAGRINLFRVYQGVMQAGHAGAEHARAREGADRPAADVRGRADRPCERVRSGRHRRRREAQGDAGRRLAGGARRADRDADRSSCLRQ